MQFFLYIFKNTLIIIIVQLRQKKKQLYQNQKCTYFNTKFASFETLITLATPIIDSLFSD